MRLIFNKKIYLFMALICIVLDLIADSNQIKLGYVKVVLKNYTKEALKLDYYFNYKNHGYDVVKTSIFHSYKPLEHKFFIKQGDQQIVKFRTVVGCYGARTILNNGDYYTGKDITDSYNDGSFEKQLKKDSSCTSMYSDGTRIFVSPAFGVETNSIPQQSPAEVFIPKPDKNGDVIPVITCHVWKKEDDERTRLLNDLMYPGRNNEKVGSNCPIRCTLL